MSLEPDRSEYDALGSALLVRVRRAERRRRAVQFVAVGVSTAALTAAVMVAGGAIGEPPGPADAQAGLPMAAEEHVGDGAESGIRDTSTADAYAGAEAESEGDPGTEQRSSERSAVACYAMAEPRAASVTIAPGPRDPDEAVLACARIWESGVLAPIEFAAAGGDSKASPTPDLSACRLPDGSIAVFPAADARSGEFCRELGDAVEGGE